MTTDLLQYDIAMTETHHTTCSKHVVVDREGLVSMRPSHVYFWMCTKHRFQKKTQKNNDNLKYLINSNGFPFLIWYISSFVFVLLDEQGTRKEMPLQEVILTSASWRVLVALILPCIIMSHFYF